MIFISYLFLFENKSKNNLNDFFFASSYRIVDVEISEKNICTRYYNTLLFKLGF